MTNRKTTKRALLGSVLALVLCFAMLLGSTYAWFTDTDTVAIETITAGTLQIDVTDAQDNAIETIDFEIPTNAAVNNAGDILWEPGATFVTNEFKIANVGELALKFQAKLDVTAAQATGDNVANWTAAQFDDVFECVLLDANDNVVTLTDKTTADVKLLAGESASYRLQVKMKTTVGNDFQGATISNVKLTIVATQVSAENDALGNTYDAGAEYPEFPTVNP